MISESREKVVNCNPYSLTSPPSWLQIKGQGIRCFLVKLGGSIARIKEGVRVENNCAPWDELLKGIKAPLMERDKRQKLHYTNVSTDPHRSYEQGCVWREISKGKWCWESPANSEWWLLQQHWGDTSAQCREHCAFSWGVWGAHWCCWDSCSSDCSQKLRALFHDPVLITT